MFLSFCQCSARTMSSEVIVVDGGSHDNTISAAKSAGAQHVLTSPVAGRSVQMNLGAAKSNGEILVFLHADSTLPAHYDTMIKQNMGMRSTWGCFESIDISQDVHPVIATIMKHAVAFRTKVFHRPYGDQALFVRKDQFNKLHGYKSEWKLLEDLDLVQRLNSASGPPCIVPTSLQTSGRRWKKLGIIRTTLINQYILFKYAMGCDVNELEKIYRKRSVT